METGNGMGHEPMHKIIKLKRYEKPPEGYYEDFLREFHRRQRAEMLAPSLSAMIMERLSGLIPELRVPAMAFCLCCRCCDDRQCRHHPRYTSANYSPRLFRLLRSAPTILSSTGNHPEYATRLASGSCRSTESTAGSAYPLPSLLPFASPSGDP